MLQMSFVDDIILVMSVNPVAEGDSVTLGCKLRTGVFQLLSNVSFYQNDKIIQNDTRGEVTLSEVLKSGEGFYKCRSSEKESPQTWMAVKCEYDCILTVCMISFDRSST